MSTLKLTNEELQRAGRIRKTMLEWDSILKNNPTFDDVYDYLNDTFISATGKPFKIECEGDKKFLEYVCNQYLNQNK